MFGHRQVIGDGPAYPSLVRSYTRRLSQTWLHDSKQTSTNRHTLKFKIPKLTEAWPNLQGKVSINESWKVCQVQEHLTESARTCPFPRITICRISLIKNQRLRLTLQQATENSKEGKTKARMKDKETKHKIKHESSMHNSASLTPVQGPSKVACMIVTSLSQLPHWLHQLPTVGKGQWKH